MIATGHIAPLTSPALVRKSLQGNGVVVVAAGHGSDGTTRLDEPGDNGVICGTTI
jgi:hypothetical protein